jgi:predicted membrane-bound mannosyltransferase
VITTPVHPFASFDRKTVLLVLALTFLALGLRLYHLSSQSLWLDEVYSVFTARVPMDQVYYYSSKLSNSLPTYFLLLKAALPESNTDIEYDARLLSVLAGALSVPVFIGVVYCWRRHTGAALLAGLLLAVNPLHIWYSQEARAYTLMLFFGLLAILFLELALFSRRSEWLTLYLFSALAAAALHRCALIFAGLCIVWHALYLSRQGKPVVQIIKQLLVHLPIGIGALCLIFVKLSPPPEGYRHAGSVLQFGYTFMTFLGGYSFGPSLTEIQNHGPLAAVARNWLQVAMLLAVLALIAAAYKLNWRKLVPTKETALLAAGIGIVAAYSMVSGFLYNVRYVLPSLFGFLALIAALVVSLPDRRRLVQLITVAVLAIALWADAQWFYSPRYRKPDARALAKWLVDNKDRVKTWEVFPAYLNAPLHWYLFDLHQDVLKQDMTSIGTNSFPPVPDVLIVTRRDQLDHPDKLISSYRLAVGGVQTNCLFAGYELYISDPPYSTRH